MHPPIPADTAAVPTSCPGSYSMATSVCPSYSGCCLIWREWRRARGRGKVVGGGRVGVTTSCPLPVAPVILEAGVETGAGRISPSAQLWRIFAEMVSRKPAGRWQLLVINITGSSGTPRKSLNRCSAVLLAACQLSWKLGAGEVGPSENTCPFPTLVAADA